VPLSPFAGDIAKLSLLSMASKKSFKQHNRFIAPITNDLHRANNSNRRLWQRVLSNSSNSKHLFNSRIVRKYMQKMTGSGIFKSSTSYLPCSRSTNNGNCGDDNGNNNDNGNSSINIPEELSRLLVERSITMEDLNYYVFNSASLQDNLNEHLLQCSAIALKTENLGNKKKGSNNLTSMDTGFEPDGHEEAVSLALRWAKAHTKVLEFALQTKTVGHGEFNNVAECVHFAARCIHWNAQVELAVAYDMREWLLEVLGQDKLESDTDFFGPHRPPPDVYQPALDFSQFNSFDAATGGIDQASLGSYLGWLYWGPTVTACRTDTPVVRLISELELQEDEHYLKSILPQP
jgi:hypothetical protein